MTKQQQAARDKAIAGLQRALGATQAGSDLSAIDLASIVDDIIAAATSRPSDHEAAVQQMRSRPGQLTSEEDR